MVNVLAIYLMMLYGLRISELVAIKWKDICFVSCEMLFISTKTGNQIAHHLSGLAITWLKELKFYSVHNDYVFPARKSNSTKEYVDTSTINNFVNRHANALNIVVHDFRRTTRSILAREGTPRYVAEAYINHGEGKDRYDMYEYFPERTEATERLSSLMRTFINTTGEDK